MILDIPVMIPVMFLVVILIMIPVIPVMNPVFTITCSCFGFIIVSVMYSRSGPSYDFATLILYAWITVT